MKQLLSYENVRLYPRKFPGISRKDNDTSVTLGKFTFDIPVMPANMKCTIDWKIAGALAESNYFYIMHRFGDTKAFIANANLENWRIVSISVGIQNTDKELVDWIKNNKYRVDYITIDVAHGHADAVHKMMTYILEQLPTAFLIVGNICTLDAALDITAWGADALKVGIAQGGACTTHGKTGFGLPMFSCVHDIARATCPPSSPASQFSVTPTEPLGKIIPIIADGGIKTNGDIAKALVAGATMVMAGSMFAALVDSPAEILSPLVGQRKVYYGSASTANGNTKNIEGTTIYLPLDNRTYREKLKEIKQDLQSSISYAGGVDLSELWNVEYGYTN